MWWGEDKDFVGVTVLEKGVGRSDGNGDVNGLELFWKHEQCQG
jgi:hypothetical protein